MNAHTTVSGEVVEIKREAYADAIGEGKPILHEHWEELALYSDIPLDPDFDVYEVLDKKGQLSLYTVRASGEMVGYAVYFTRPHHHYKNHVWALCDIVLIRKPYRKFGIGNRLFDFIENDLRAQGVHVIHTMTKSAHPELAFLLRSRGHQAAELSFSKRL